MSLSVSDSDLICELAQNKESVSFALLHPKIQRWIWLKKWHSLRDIQEQAVPLLLKGDQDLVIAAATATGKTEAVFLPILSQLLFSIESQQLGDLHCKKQKTLSCVLYISPLKALINDQWVRLSALCDDLDIPVTPWHGDAMSSKKQQFLKKPQGILLITPESLEALFINRGSSIAYLFQQLRYLVVDELHAFIGTERGKQLQSLMHRITFSLKHFVPRIGLSATLGDMSLAATFLRSHTSVLVDNDQLKPVKVIISTEDKQELKILIKAYVSESISYQMNNALDGIKLDGIKQDDIKQDFKFVGHHEIAHHLYQVLKSGNHLIFPNSRALVELYADYLRSFCEQDKIANYFWPHHGNLSKGLREQTEQALKDHSKRAIGICTSTLELGIDIGSVVCVVQIGSPPSVASLRQRLGRSGRREGEAAILRGYCIEPLISEQSGFSDRIHEGLVQSIAMVHLLIENWFEPPRLYGMHGSTLVQQILSIIAEKGGVSASYLWNILIKSGVFSELTQPQFMLLLRHLAQLDLIIQESSGLLLHGSLGERLVNHYNFYSAFITEEEFTLQCDGKILGTLAVSQPLVRQQNIIFAGKRWCIEQIDDNVKQIIVVPDVSGTPPAFNSGQGALIDDHVRQRMKLILSTNIKLSFIDKTAQELLQKARAYVDSLKLTEQCSIESGHTLLLMTWLGDRLNNTVALLLTNQGLVASNEGVFILIQHCTRNDLHDEIIAILAEPEHKIKDLLMNVKNLAHEKWDWALPRSLLEQSVISQTLDPEGAIEYFKTLTI